MAAEISQRQLGERLVPRQAPGVGRAFGDLRVRELLAATRATADHPFELREERQQCERHSPGHDTGAAEMCPELAAGQRVSIEHSLEDSSRAGSSCDVEALPAEVMGEGLMHARRCQLQHPADVGPGNEMPGRAHHVCTQDLSSVEGSIELPLGGRLRQSKTETPLRGAELLRLHRAKPGHEIGGPAMARSSDALIVEPQLRNRRHAHVEQVAAGR